MSKQRFAQSYCCRKQLRVAHASSLKCNRCDSQLTIYIYIALLPTNTVEQRRLIRPFDSKTTTLNMHRCSSRLDCGLFRTIRWTIKRTTPSKRSRLTKIYGLPQAPTGHCWRQATPTCIYLASKAASLYPSKTARVTKYVLLNLYYTPSDLELCNDQYRYYLQGQPGKYIGTQVSLACTPCKPVQSIYSYNLSTRTWVQLYCLCLCEC